MIGKNQNFSGELVAQISWALGETAFAFVDTRVCSTFSKNYFYNTSMYQSYSNNDIHVYISNRKLKKRIINPMTLSIVSNIKKIFANNTKKNNISLSKKILNLMIFFVNYKKN